MFRFLRKEGEVTALSLQVTEQGRWRHVAWGDGRKLFGPRFGLPATFDSAALNGELESLYREWRRAHRIPQRSELIVGGIHGVWAFLPPDLADIVRARIDSYHRG
jgi:hypothetical protein